MPTLEFFIVAESVSVDQATNRLSIFNVLEESHHLKFPAPIPALVAIATWNVESNDLDQDFQAMVRVTEPGGKEFPFAQNFKAKGHRHRVMFYFQGIPVTSEGTLRFELLLNGSHAAWHTVDVVDDSPK